VRKCDAADLVTRLCDQRLAFLKGLKTWPVFGGGWGRRVSEVRAAALAMSRSAARPATTPAVTPVGASLAGKILAALWSAWRHARSRGAAEIKTGT
jgi:lysozyme family protein